MTKFDARVALTAALYVAGFRLDPRAKRAFKLPGQENWRVDMGGARTVRLERANRGTWSGAHEPLYYGKLRDEAHVIEYVLWFKSVITGRRMTEPKATPTLKESSRARERIERELLAKAKKNGPGYYVTNGSTAMHKTRMAEHGPYSNKEEAISKAWSVYSEYVNLQISYLLPVVVIESLSRDRASDGDGYVWWIDGRRKAEPVDPSQARLFADSKKKKGRR